MDHDPVALCGHDDCHVNNLGFGIWGGVLDGEALDSRLSKPRQRGSIATQTSRLNTQTTVPSRMIHPSHLAASP